VLALAVIAAILTGDGAEPAAPTGRIVLDPDARSLVPEDRSGDPVPDGVYETLDGGRGSLADHRGLPLVVNFWASNCEPCIREMPVLEAAHQQLAGRVAFVGVNVTDPVGPARSLAARTGVTYHNARDPDGTMLQAFGGVALPTTAFVSPEGRILTVVTGELSAEKLQARLTEAFG
jgi:cytochrome c biogenesis protein CcmG, thiol:disulfide interchange protein DsbE